MRQPATPQELAPAPPRSALPITALKVAALCGKSPPGGWSHEIAAEDSVHALIAVHCEGGLTGFGSAFTSGALAKAAAEVLRPLLIGENALEPDRVAQKLHQNTFWMGRGGAITHAISGIDIALWDLLGKATGLSVGRLLGGRYRERVRPYCSLLMEAPERMEAVIAPHREAGFRAFKIGWGPFGRQGDARLDRAIVAAARRAAGDEAQLFVDAGASDAFWPNGLKWALNTASMLADFGVGWFEEPLPPDALADFVTLRRQSPVPIAGGEVLTRRQSFTPWLVQGALDIVQPDVTKVGGLSEQRRIAWMAHEFGVRHVGHGWNTALGLAADLQLAAALPDGELVEYIGGSAYVDRLSARPFALDDKGLLPVPDRPGLGMELNAEELRKLSPDAVEFLAG